MREAAIKAASFFNSFVDIIPFTTKCILTGHLPLIKEYIYEKEANRNEKSNVRYIIAQLRHRNDSV